MRRGCMAASMTYIYIIFILVFSAMATWVIRRVKSNRVKFIEENSPTVAGSDSIKGSIENDGRYDEPSEDDLEQMEKLLDDAAESQGLEYND
jgi:hypothetical protein